MDYTERGQDTRIARFISVDPLTKAFPWYFPYQFAGNTPIQAIDLDGEEPSKVNSAKDKDSRITSISVTTIYEVGNSIEDNMEFTLNGVSQENRKIASSGVRNGDKTEFRDNFTRLEKLVLDNGTTTEEMRKFSYFQSNDGTIKSKDYKGREVKMVTKSLEFKNSIWLLVTDKSQLNNVMKNFNNSKDGYKLSSASDEFSMYNIAIQAEYKEKVYTEIKKLGIQDDQINWLQDLPSDGSQGVMKYSVGTIKKSKTESGDTSKKSTSPSGSAIYAR